jgi:hypothetical protein
MAILKIHSHPGDFPHFSHVDDQSDRELFPSLHGWTDDGKPHASAVMLSDGRIFGRFAEEDGSLVKIDRVAVAADDILFFDAEERAHAGMDGVQLRTRQVFGNKTVELLRSLRVAVVGCSGTGSWIAEQLARLGVGELILIDPDKVEDKNLNRILATSEGDIGISKVEALRKRLTTYGTNVRVKPLPSTVLTEAAVHLLATCDVLFGCMDTVEGRDILNRTASFYSIPYFDLGVQLRADGRGNVETVCGSVHFLLPDGSSLFSRGVYTPEMLRAESLKRTNPAQYAAELDEGYIRGVAVGSPAVISVNGFCATMAVNEFLARIHPFRNDDNADFQWQQFDIVNSSWQPQHCGKPCPVLSRHAGRGDMLPLLNCSLVES